MNMLATLGFAATGLCFGIFAYTFDRYVIQKTNLRLKQFSYAYYLLALALVMWGIAAAIGGDDLLRRSVIVGNVFLLIGTLFMLDIWLGTKNRAWLWLAAVISALLVLVRINHYSPVPYMKGGVLIFNTQRPVMGLLAAIFLFVWLPINIKVAHRVTSAIKQPGMQPIYSGIYVAATFFALIFLTTRRVLTTVLSFVALSICSVLLIASNVLVSKLKEKNGPK